MSKLIDRRSHRGGRPASALAYRLAYKAQCEESATAEPLASDTGFNVADEECVDTGGLGSESRWISTPTGEAVLAGLRYAQLAGDIVVIYGGAGLGKSHAARHYLTTVSNAFRAEMSPATGGAVLHCLEELATAVGVRSVGHTAAVMHRSICCLLLGSRGLIIIDEAQELGIHALDQVRCIHDQARVGIALIGNERIYSQMTGSNRAAYLDRLHSRIGKRIHLKRATEADADAVIAAWGVSDRDSRVRLREIARKPGALRVLGKTLRLAHAYAEGRQLTSEYVEAAWQDLGGLD